MCYLVSRFSHRLSLTSNLHVVPVAQGETGWVPTEGDREEDQLTHTILCRNRTGDSDKRLRGPLHILSLLQGPLSRLLVSRMVHSTLV